MARLPDEILAEIAAHQSAIHGLYHELLGDPSKGVSVSLSNMEWPRADDTKDEYDGNIE